MLRTHAPSSRQGRIRVSVAALTTACVLVGTGIPIAGASDSQAPAQSSTALIIDASGSMWAPDGVAQLRTTTANQLAHRIVDTIPTDQKLALLTYGIGTGNSDEEMEAGCKDVHTLVPLGGSKQEITDQIDGIHPSGYTPISEAFLAAEKELGNDDTRRIVLISDGIDTCAPPDMAEVAEKIHSRGEISIDVIGVNVDEDVRSQLEKLAAAGGGTYADAWDAEGLIGKYSAPKGMPKPTDKATEVTKDEAEGVDKTEAIDPEVVKGHATGAHGADTADAAPMLNLANEHGDPTSVALFTDTIATGAQRHWTITLGEEEQLSSAFLVELPAVAQSGASQKLTLTPELKTTGGKVCSSSVKEAETTGASAAVVSASLLSKVAKNNTECPPGRYTLSVKRTGELAADTDLPVWFSAWPVPRIDAQKLPSNSDEPKVEELALGGSADKLTTSADPDSAPTVESGTYELTLKPGQTHWFKVPVGHGQRLQMHMEADAVGGDGHSVTWEAFGPLLHQLRTKDAGPVDLKAEEKTEADFASEPIRWANLKGATAVATSFIAGDQYVALRHNAPAEVEGDEASKPINVHLAVAATGQADSGPDLSKHSAGAKNSANTTTGQWSGIWWLFLLLFVVGFLATWLSSKKKNQN